MPNLEGQPGGGEIQNGSDATQTQVEATPSADSSPAKQDHSGEVKALQAQLDRFKEDLDRERETSRLLQNFIQQNNGKKPEPDDDEYKDVDKTLGPWLERRLKPYVDRFSGTLADYYDKLDRLEFYNDRINEDPELSERLNPGIPIDEIDRYRMRVAQTEGRYISRNNALAVLRGMKSISEDKKSRATKKQQSQVDESIRQVAVEAAQSGEEKPGVKPPRGGADPVLAKLRSGGRLTEEERSKAKDALKDVEF